MFGGLGGFTSPDNTEAFRCHTEQIRGNKRDGKRANIHTCAHRCTAGALLSMGSAEVHAWTMCPVAPLTVSSC